MKWTVLLVLLATLPTIPFAQADDSPPPGCPFDLADCAPSIVLESTLNPFCPLSMASVVGGVMVCIDDFHDAEKVSAVHTESFTTVWTTYLYTYTLPGGTSFTVPCTKDDGDELGVDVCGAGPNAVQGPRVEAVPRVTLSPPEIGLHVGTLAYLVEANLTAMAPNVGTTIPIVLVCQDPVCTAPLFVG